MNLIEGHLIVTIIVRTSYLRMRSLDDPDGRFLSLGASAEKQDGLSQRTVHHNFIVNRIICQTVHGPADHRFLTFQRSCLQRIFLRQPGEYRDLRGIHSVGHQVLFPLAVISTAWGLPNFNDTRPAGALRIVRTGAASPFAVNEKHVTDEFPMLETQNSLFFVSTEMPAGWLRPVFCPFIIRDGATLP